MLVITIIFVMFIPSAVIPVHLIKPKIKEKTSFIKVTGQNIKIIVSVTRTTAVLIEQIFLVIKYGQVWVKKLYA